MVSARDGFRETMAGPEFSIRRGCGIWATAVGCTPGGGATMARTLRSSAGLLVRTATAARLIMGWRADQWAVRFNSDPLSLWPPVTVAPAILARVTTAVLTARIGAVMRHDELDSMASRSRFATAAAYSSSATRCLRAVVSADAAASCAV